MCFETVYEPIAEMQLLKVLQITAFNVEMISKTKRTYDLISFVQTQYRRHKEAIETRINFLIYELWDE